MLIGATGGIFDCATFVEWFKNGADRDRLPKYEDEGMVALVLARSGLWLYDWQGIGVPIREGLHAIGTGSAPALAALRHGMSPRVAVEMAMSVDIYSGGEVHEESLY